MRSPKEPDQRVSLSAQFDEADLDPSLQLGCWRRNLRSLLCVFELQGEPCVLCDFLTFHGRARSLVPTSSGRSTGLGPGWLLSAHRRLVNARSPRRVAAYLGLQTADQVAGGISDFTGSHSINPFFPEVFLKWLLHLAVSMTDKIPALLVGVMGKKSQQLLKIGLS